MTHDQLPLAQRRRQDPIIQRPSLLFRREAEGRQFNRLLHLDAQLVIRIRIRIRIRTVAAVMIVITSIVIIFIAPAPAERTSIPFAKDIREPGNNGGSAFYGCTLFNIMIIITIIKSNNLTFVETYPRVFVGVVVVVILVRLVRIGSLELRC